jgi:hypothetical protein
VVRPCLKNDGRKIAQDSIEVEAETKETTRKTEEKLDGGNKEGHGRKKPKGKPVRRQKAMESGCRTAKKSLETDIYICFFLSLSLSRGKFYIIYIFWLPWMMFSGADWFMELATYGMGGLPSHLSVEDSDLLIFALVV